MLARTLKNIAEYRRALAPRVNVEAGHLTFPTYVINLDRSTDRRRYITAHLAGLGISPTLVSAYDGRALVLPELVAKGTYCEADALSAFSRPLSMAEIGCSLSHASIYRSMIENKIPMALVLEDDAQLVDNVRDELGALIAEAPADWELIQLRFDSREFHQVSPRVVAFEFKQDWPVAATAYLLRLSAARKLLDKLMPIRYPADSLLGRAHYWDVRTYGAWPELAGVNNVFPSSIQGSRNWRFRLSNAVKGLLLRLLR